MSEQEHQPGETTPEETPKQRLNIDPKKTIFKPTNPEGKVEKRIKYWIGISPYHPKSGMIDEEAWKPLDDSDAPHAGEWAQAADDAFYSVMRDDYPQRMMTLSLGQWKQSFAHKGTYVGLAPRAEGLSKLQGKTKVTGRVFMAATRKRSSANGVEVMIPLFHTGVWVSIKPAKEIRWLAFDTERTERRIGLGRDTMGLMLTARSGYEQQDVLDFCMEHVTSCNVKSFDNETFLTKMSALDIPVLIWGFCAANYIEGFPVRIPCLVNPGKCQHVTEAIARIRNMSWENPDKLTDKQLDYIADYKLDRSDDDLKAYQQDGIFGEERVISLPGGTLITLQIPNAAHNLYCSRRWIEDITMEIDASLKKSGRGERVSEQNRMTHLLRGLEQSQLREYVAWIKKIEEPVGDGDIGGGTYAWSDSIDDIEAWCEENASDTDISKKLYEEIKQYMSDMTANVIGYPVFKCPKCQQGADIGDADFHEQDVDAIVAIDPIKYFLILMARRLEATKNLLPLNRMGR